MIKVFSGSAVLCDYPCPPTSNHLYFVARNRLIKSKEGRLYSLKVQQWYLKNKSAVDKIKEILRGKTLRVDCTFYFPKEKILTKKNTLKKADWSSRLKQTHDELSKLIGVDDSHFISGYCCKKISDTEEAYVDITISEENLERRDESEQSHSTTVVK